jgi:signal peptidase II
MSSFFNLVHYRNQGAAFGFLSDAGGWQRHLLVVVALGVSVWLTQILRRRLPPIEALGYSLVLGGALGNMLDRVLRGSVVDYLDFHWRSSHWPAFNLADVAITLGVICILGSALRPQQVVDRDHAAG